jgi:hypothetical protein
VTGAGIAAGILVVWLAAGGVVVAWFHELASRRRK